MGLSNSLACLGFDLIKLGVFTVRRNIVGDQRISVSWHVLRKGMGQEISGTSMILLLFSYIVRWATGWPVMPTSTCFCTDITHVMSLT